MGAGLTGVLVLASSIAAAVPARAPLRRPGPVPRRPDPGHHRLRRRPPGPGDPGRPRSLQGLRQVLRLREHRCGCSPASPCGCRRSTRQGPTPWRPASARRWPSLLALRSEHDLGSRGPAAPTGRELRRPLGLAAGGVAPHRLPALRRRRRRRAAGRRATEAGEATCSSPAWPSPACPCSSSRPSRRRCCRSSPPWPARAASTEFRDRLWRLLGRGRPAIGSSACSGGPLLGSHRHRHRCSAPSTSLDRHRPGPAGRLQRRVHARRGPGPGPDRPRGPVPGRHRLVGRRHRLRGRDRPRRRPLPPGRGGHGRRFGGRRRSSSASWPATACTAASAPTRTPCYRPRRRRPSTRSLKVDAGSR